MLEGILSKALRLESGDYGDLVKTLKSVRNYIFNSESNLKKM